MRCSICPLVIVGLHSLSVKCWLSLFMTTWTWGSGVESGASNTAALSFYSFHTLAFMEDFSFKRKRFCLKGWKTINVDDKLILNRNWSVCPWCLTHRKGSRQFCSRNRKVNVLSQAPWNSGFHLSQLFETRVFGSVLRLSLMAFSG